MQEFSNLSVLVTGGAGFIGSHTCEALLAHGCRVTAIDSFDPYYPRAEKEKNLEVCLASPGFTLAEGDIREEAFVNRVFADSKPELVIHLAAKAGVRPSIEDPAGYADVNVRGTSIILEAGRKAGVRSLVFASSSSVYGDQNSVPFRESDRTDHPLSPYGATKKSGEALCFTHHHLYGMSVACLRFFTVYGPRQRPDLAIRKFVDLALRGKAIPLFGDGSSRRDYTHIRDILSGILGAVSWVRSDLPRYGVFNLGSSKPILLRDLVTMIETNLGKPVQRIHLPFQSGDMPQTYADTSLAEREFGFRHEVSFAEGLHEFIVWMKART